jgi:hypothetical protein
MKMKFDPRDAKDLAKLDHVPSLHDIDQLLRAGKRDQKTRVNETVSKESEAANQKILDIYVKRNGWPHLRQERLHPATSKKLAQAAWLIMQHGNPEYMRSYFPVLKASAKKGHAQATNLAKTVDRLLMYDGEPQLYGTNASNRNEGEVMEIFVKGSIEEVNFRRSKVGIRISLAEQAKLQNAIIFTTKDSPEYKPIKYGR